MAIIRLNTFFFDFRGVITLLAIEINSWFSTLGIKDEDAVVIHYSKYRKRVTLKLQNSELFIKLLDRFSERGVTYTVAGVEYAFPFLVINGRKKI